MGEAVYIVHCEAEATSHRYLSEEPANRFMLHINVNVLGTTKLNTSLTCVADEFQNLVIITKNVDGLSLGSILSLVKARSWDVTEPEGNQP